MEMARKSSGQTDYKIGKGRPPRHTRWEKGTSGNPGGKKKGAVNLETTFQEAVIRPVTLTLNGEKKVISALDALVMRLFDNGIKGDIKAINSILDRIERLIKSEQKQDPETSEEDIEILQRVLAKREFSGLTDAMVKLSDADEETDGKDLVLDEREEARD
ncbi:MAG TPA: DUF5681 domain-containing protein [Methylocella sp.]|jgi:hypothetical protein